MISPEFSRRIAKIMNTNSILKRGNEWRKEFVLTIELANSFGKLSLELQKIILKAEQELKEPTNVS